MLIVVTGREGKRCCFNSEDLVAVDETEYGSIVKFTKEGMDFFSETIMPFNEVVELWKESICHRS